MKKLIAIILVLAVIFVGMLVYRNITIKENTVSVEEVERIENYIKKIYLWKDVTGSALPCFEDINQADDRWVWEAVKKNIEDEVLTYEQIHQGAKQLFGENFEKQFPKEGTDYLVYNSETNEYDPISVRIGAESDMFLLDKIFKKTEGYEVEIIEYIEDSSPMLQEEAADYIIIRNTKGEEIGRVGGRSRGRTRNRISKKEYREF